MNRIVNILITFVFLVSFIGIQISKHYSNGKLYSIAFYHDAEACNAEEGKCEADNMGQGHCKSQKQKEQSCKDEIRFLKIDDVFNKEEVSLNPVIHTYEATIPNQCLTNVFCPVALKDVFSVSSFSLLLQRTQPELCQFLC